MGGPKRPGRRSGQMVVFVSLSLFFLFAVIGLSVDLGYAYVVKMTAQAAADSAAQAAAIYAGKNGFVCGTGVTCNTTYTCANPPTSPPTTPLQAGCLYAQANGFLNTGSQTVSLIANNTAPPNETGNAPALWIQASVTQSINNKFLYWAGFHTGSVASQAIAGVTVIAPNSCIYILNASVAGALTVQGSGSIIGNGCGIHVNSSNTTDAISQTGGSFIEAINGGKIYMVSGAVENTAPGGTFSPSPTVAPAAVDPLINLPAPTVSTTCSQTNYYIANASTATINPGVYCGGITTGGSAVLTLNPGMYILNGGGFNNTNNAIVNGTGVTFFLTGQHGYMAAGMNLDGSSHTNVTAPSSGTYQGVLFYQDRSVTYAAGNAQTNSAYLNATGTFYFPTTSLSLAGYVTENKIALIVNTLSITGASEYDNDTTGTYTGLTTKNSGLIE